MNTQPLFAGNIPILRYSQLSLPFRDKENPETSAVKLGPYQIETPLWNGLDIQVKTNVAPQFKTNPDEDVLITLSREDEVLLKPLRDTKEPIGLKWIKTGWHLVWGEDLPENAKDLMHN